MEPTTIKRFFHRIFQNFLMSFPALSEISLAKSKVVNFLRVWHYLSRAKVSGDYLEFGVFEGMSFDLSLSSAKRFFSQSLADSPKFYAFDSFRGLPDNHLTRDSNVFEKGTYKAVLEKFKKNIQKNSRGWEVKIIEGFYQDSLKKEIINENSIKSASFVNIDCDLYESTLLALKFTTPLLKTGSVIFFDDWYSSGGDMRLGEAGACADWLLENDKIKLIDYGDVGIMGKLFIVNMRN